jgi:hypothetical protein
MDRPPNEGDIWLSRINVSLARSQRELQSWLPPKDTTSGALLSQNDPEDDDDEDFIAMGESAGIGIKPRLDDNGLPSKSKLSATNQKLLEQLLGKKAATANLKERKPPPTNTGLDASKPMPSSSKTAPAATQDGSDDDEEDGRAAMLTSSSRGARKVRDTKRPAYATAGGNADTLINPDVEPPDPREDPATVLDIISQDNAVSAEQEVERDVKRPAKRKATSYMDEILAKKKKKKGKAKSG